MTPNSAAVTQGDTAKADRSRGDRAIAIWLLICCAMIFTMAVIGAITRLTESGLSIMEWAPITGALPPLNQAEWQRLFDIYRQIPEYTQVNFGMTLDEFKTIFWWEYVHRLWGRSIGVIFAIPFFWFLLRGKIRRPLLPHLIAMFVLGGLQGLLGWYMVASGFAEREDVSQYRLVAHLGFAILIYGYIFWIALGLLFPAPAPSRDAAGGGLARALVALTVLTAITIASGGFVAGTNAGMIYNSFPLMGGDLVPADYAMLRPWYINAFENIAAVQFNHRVLAMVTLIAAVLLWPWSRRFNLAQRARNACTLLAIAAFAQVGLGIVTLLLVVPVWLGALHQAGAIALFTAVLWAIFHLRPVKI